MNQDLQRDMLVEVSTLLKEAPNLIDDESEEEVVEYMMELGKDATLKAERRGLNRGQMALGVVLVMHAIMDEDSPINDPEYGVFEK